MSINSDNNGVSPTYTGNGVTTTFQFDFKVFSEDELIVRITDTDGTISILTLDDDYSVTLYETPSNNYYGEITLSAALTTDYSLVITSNVAFTQETEITSQGGFDPDVLNDIHDKLTILSQQLKGQFERSIQIPFGEDLEIELPSATNRSNKAIVFDTFGNVTISSDDYEDQVSNATALVAEAQGYATAAASSSSDAEDSANASASSATEASSYASASASSAAESESYALAAQATLSSALWRDVVFATSNLTLDDSYNGKLIRVDTTLGAVAITLPTISGLVLPYTVGIKKESSDGNTVTISPSGDNLLSGKTSKVLSSADSGSTLVADTDPSPDEWTCVDFGLVGSNITVDTFSGDGVTTSFTLSISPGSINNTFVFIGGLYQQKSTYSLSSQTITFTSPPSSGANNVQIVSGTVLSIGVPSDNTVTTAKITDSAITTAKIPDNAITNAKLNIMAANTFKGNITTGSTAPQDISSSALVTALGVVKSVNTVKFTSSGTYTKPSNLIFIDVECIGGGGGGGGALTSSYYYSGGGGGAGGYSKTRIYNSNLSTTTTVTVGSAGSAGTGSTSAPSYGGSGGTTSFETSCIAYGGSGGGYGYTGAGTGSSVPTEVGGSGAPSGVGNVLAIRGNYGQPPINILSAASYPTDFVRIVGLGGVSIYGAVGNKSNRSALDYGSGGVGGFYNLTSGNGGIGGAGICIITEYLSA